jgi:hypothetical protein
MFQHPGTQPWPAGVDQVASIYRIASGFLVSYRPKPPTVAPLVPEALEKLRAETREREREKLRAQFQKEALTAGIVGLALGKNTVRGVEEETEGSWKGGEEAPDRNKEIDRRIEEVVDRLVEVQMPSLAIPAGLGYYGCQDQARAFATLEEALEFLKEVL